jgi:hypothetical protein
MPHIPDHLIPGLSEVTLLRELPPTTDMLAPGITSIVLELPFLATFLFTSRFVRVVKTSKESFAQWAFPAGSQNC